MKRVTLKRLSKAHLRRLTRMSDAWRKRMQPHHDAIRESTNIRAEDLAVRVKGHP